jgi:hypothetical protein
MDSEAKSMTNLLRAIADEYIDFHVANKRVNIPYCIVGKGGGKRVPPQAGRTTRYSHFAAKGTPEQIRQTLCAAAKTKGFDLRNHSPAEITQFMLEEGIGIDCSGFVYNVLEKYLREARGIELSKHLLRFPGIIGHIERFLLQRNRVRRINAITLSGSLNATPVDKVRDIRPGDMIFMSYANGTDKHVALIIEVNRKQITYTHVNERVQNQYPHYATIDIVDGEKGLEAQRWNEKTFDGKNYGEVSFSPARGNLVSRLNILNS